MASKLITILSLLGIIFYPHKNNNGNGITTRHVFQVDYSFPTADKPQSKLWFMDNCWWALLPESTGPSLWQRTQNGWKEHADVSEQLKGIPGRVDVFADENQILAVGVADSFLTVFSLRNNGNSTNYSFKSKILAKLLPPSCHNPVETATIVKDTKESWWVAAVVDTKLCVWSSLGNTVDTPLILAEGMDEDDICVITSLPNNSIGVIWSDQVREGVYMRAHIDGKPMDSWGDETVVEEGNKTADDHLNTSLSPDGTLWMATKNSVDQIGKPQFVLRVRNKNGHWNNIPYVTLEGRKKPSRPIVIATEDNSYVFSLYGDNDRSIPYPYDAKIVCAFAHVDSVTQEKLNDPLPVIVPDSSYKYVVHNVTGPKSPFPQNAPWIILASDSKGYVYEADLRNLIKQ